MFILLFVCLSFLRILASDNPCEIIPHLSVLGHTVEPF